MGERPSPEEARRLVTEASDTDLWRIASALDRSGPSFPGNVSSQLVAEMLEVGEPENWERTTRPSSTNDRESDLFRPYAIVPKDDGNKYRSWLPEDLLPDDELGIRSLAESCANHQIRARLYEILWARFKAFPDAKAAIEARFLAAHGGDPDKAWPRLVKNLGRLTTLILSVNAKDKLEELFAALDSGADRLIASGRPFSFTALADMVGNTILTKSSHRQAFTTVRAQKWAVRLADLAKQHWADTNVAHDALMVLQAWHARHSDEEATRTVRRDVVNQLRDAGSQAKPAMVGTSFYQRALQAALDFGISDLAEIVRGELMQSVRQTLPDFKSVSRTLTLPPELISAVDSIFELNPSLPAAVRELSVLPGLLELDVDHIRERAKAHLQESPLLAMIPSVQYHPDGRITHTASGIEGNIDRHTAFLCGSQLAIVEGLLRHVLVRAMPRVTEETLLAALADWPHLAGSRRDLLSIAAGRFANSDWVSCGFIITSVYEAVLRDLLRATGYAALKVESDGTQMDETLSSLIRAPAARSLLGEGHCNFVEYMLCDPALGWNLRNEIAHGTIRPGTLTPMRTFLVWLLVIRLTCFVATPSPPPPASATDGGGAAPKAPTT